jgi:hypothetical protein
MTGAVHGSTRSHSSSTVRSYAGVEKGKNTDIDSRVGGENLYRSQRGSRHTKKGGVLRATAAVQHAWIQQHGVQGESQGSTPGGLTQWFRRMVTPSASRPGRSRAAGAGQSAALFCPGASPLRHVLAQVSVGAGRAGGQSAPHWARARSGRPPWQTRRRFTVPTALGHAQTVAPNQLNRECTVDAPDKVYEGDIPHRRALKPMNFDSQDQHGLPVKWCGATITTIFRRAPCWSKAMIPAVSASHKRYPL